MSMQIPLWSSRLNVIYLSSDVETEWKIFGSITQSCSRDEKAGLIAYKSRSSSGKVLTST